MKPPTSGPTAAAIAAAAPTSAYARRCMAPSKLPWISDCIAGRSSDAPSPPTTAQKITIGSEALRERHRERADRVPEQAEHVGALAADQVADLAADQDERSRDERLERDRRLHAARGRVEVVHDGRDRHVHQRRVDDEHEHRHREQDREQMVAFRLLGSGSPSRCHAGSRPSTRLCAVLRGERPVSPI